MIENIKFKIENKEEIINLKRNFKKYRLFENEEKELLEYLKENNKEEIKETIEKADRFLEGKFIFDMKWDMERCKEPYIFEGEIDWLKNPFGDSEWTYMLNRHRHIVLYGKAYFLTKEKKYLKRIEEEIEGWIEKVKVDTHKEAFRTIEVGIRLRNWAKLLELCIEDLNEDLAKKMIASMEEQVKYIFENSREDRILSNWVIMENVGVFIVLAFLKGDEKYRLKAEEMIEKSLEIQILRDGLHWEQSFMYHNEIVNCIIDMVLFSEKLDIKINSKIHEKLKNILYATLNMGDPNMCQINFGDSDIESLEDILSVGASIFNDSNLKFKTKKMPLESVFSVGHKKVLEFNKLKSEKNELKSIAFKDSGNYFIRDKNNLTFFKCGPLGSGHGHYDLLSTVINCNGEEIICDAGRYSYREDEPLRIELKGAKAHSTMTVDNKEFNESKGSWGSKRVANYIKRESYFGELGSLVEGAHTGYENMLLNRKVIYLKGGIWIFSDEFFGGDEKLLQSRFNLKYKNEKVEENKIIYKMKDGQNFNIVPLGKRDIRIEKANISEEYNSLYESDRIVLEKKGNGDECFNTVMYSDEIKVKKIEYIEILDWRKRKLDEKFARAIKIECEDEEFIVVIAHNEEDSGRKTYTVDGVQVYGRVVVIDKLKGKSEVLSY
ncbi:MAG: alginate lyase family protein [Clostridium sp.]|uniref:alginate lyase family protein n=1 Tax=Clostridium sp. TaxID=1506 RepID=UPI003F3C2040